MIRTIHLVIFSNGNRPAHFAIFIPNYDRGLTGKLIHVKGNPTTDFFLEYKRNYNFALADKLHQIIPLAQVDDRYIRDTPYLGTGIVRDTIARDTVESTAQKIRPPNHSNNPFDPLVHSCQTWTKDYVSMLVQAGIIDSSANTVIENAPQVLR